MISPFFVVCCFFFFFFRRSHFDQRACFYRQRRWTRASPLHPFLTRNPQLLKDPSDARTEPPPSAALPLYARLRDKSGTQLRRKCLAYFIPQSLGEPIQHRRAAGENDGRAQRHRTSTAVVFKLLLKRRVSSRHC